MLSIWHLLTSMCFFMGIAGSVVSATREKVGPGGYALALLTGLMVGICCAVMMWKTVKYASGLSQLRLATERNGPIISVCLAVIPWMFVTGALGRWISVALLRLVG